MKSALSLGIGVISLLVIGLIAYQRRKLSGGAPGVAGDIAGWTQESGVVLAPDVEVWLAQLARAAADAGLPAIHVTSGTRTAASQAAAMLAKVERGEDLAALYSDDAAVAVLLGLPRTVDAWTAQIQTWVDSGRYLSAHLRADAVDLRSKDLSAEQVAKLRDVAKGLGAETIIESDHLHLEDFLA